MVDRITQAWIRNRSDELAVENGCTFDVERGAHAVWWIERFCRLYEGASGPLILNGCHKCGCSGWEYLTENTEWDDETRKASIERAKKFASCVKAGHRIDWQYDCTMRVFGWVKMSERLNKKIRRFRESTIFVAKKNKKSPTLAAWALYMLAGDNEKGQKVYLCAKDGSQARDIAGGHCVKMVEKSADLAEECTINKNLMRVTHDPSDSWLQPMSSANEATQKSKEGLNGSVFIDEVHVVDRKFVKRISRAGISRDEPLMAEFSTSGDDPESYGKERFDFALQVISGEIENQGLFAEVFAAPQDLSDDDLHADPLKWGRMANPAMGHTVDPDEFLHDYEQSRTKPANLASFKMYRLNIWQSSSNPFLRMSDWMSCRRDFDESDLLGKPCAAGLDLALKWDVTAFVLVFPFGEDESGENQYRVIPYMWIPRERAYTMRDKVGWEEFERRGHVMLTDGDVTDFSLVRRTIKEACEKFDVRQINFDDRFAEAFCQQLKDDDGLPVVDFAQTPGNYNEPSFMLERLVMEGNLHHNGNTVLNWMAGNLNLKKGMPCKPDTENYKKIDGMTALIMGLASAMTIDPTESTWCSEAGSLAF